MTVPHWGSTPWQEDTRVETANRIWLSSCTRAPLIGRRNQEAYLFRELLDYC